MTRYVNEHRKFADRDRGSLVYDSATLIRALRSVVPLVLGCLLIVGFAAACATAGGDDDDDDGNRGIDAGPIAAKDAAPIADAAVPVDAAPVEADAATGGGMCSGNDDCGLAGECCFVAICVEGIEIGDNCLPN